MNLLETILVSIIILILIIIIIFIILNSINYCFYQKCSLNLSKILNTNIITTQCFLATLNNNGINQSTYKNLCKLASDSVQNKNVQDDFNKLLLNIDLQDYFIIINALQNCNILNVNYPKRY